MNQSTEEAANASDDIQQDGELQPIGRLTQIFETFALVADDKHSAPNATIDALAKEACALLSFLELSTRLEFIEHLLVNLVSYNAKITREIRALSNAKGTTNVR